jgi:hypothetical protein
VLISYPSLRPDLVAQVSLSQCESMHARGPWLLLARRPCGLSPASRARQGRRIRGSTSTCAAGGDARSWDGMGPCAVCWVHACMHAPHRPSVSPLMDRPDPCSRRRSPHRRHVHPWYLLRAIADGDRRMHAEAAGCVGRATSYTRS